MEAKWGTSSRAMGNLDEEESDPPWATMPREKGASPASISSATLRPSEFHASSTGWFGDEGSFNAVGSSLESPPRIDDAEEPWRKCRDGGMTRREDVSLSAREASASAVSSRAAASSEDLTVVEEAIRIGRFIVLSKGGPRGPCVDSRLRRMR